MKQRIVKSKFDFPKVEQQSSLKRLCYIKKEQGKAQEEKEEQEREAWVGAADRSELGVRDKEAYEG